MARGRQIQPEKPEAIIAKGFELKMNKYGIFKVNFISSLGGRTEKCLLISHCFAMKHGLSSSLIP